MPFQLGSRCINNVSICWWFKQLHRKWAESLTYFSILQPKTKNNSLPAVPWFLNWNNKRLQWGVSCGQTTFTLCLVLCSNRLMWHFPGALCAVCPESPHGHYDSGYQLCFGDGLWLHRDSGPTCIFLLIFFLCKNCLSGGWSRLNYSSSMRSDKTSGTGPVTQPQLVLPQDELDDWLIDHVKTNRFAATIYLLTAWNQVYECTPILPAWEALPLGGKAIHK